MAVEGDPWKFLILTLDGGGTRGYASLLMLQKLMNEIRQIELHESPEPHESSFGPMDDNILLEPKGPPPSATPRISVERRNQVRQELLNKRDKYLPCHYFDYIGGTSTGGLAALMLGRIRMSAHECVVDYPKMAQSIFGKKKHFYSTGGIVKDRYSATNLQNVIEDIVLEHLPEVDSPNFFQLASPGDLCKTVVIANKGDTKYSEPHLFRSYDAEESRAGNYKNPGPACTYRIWEAGRATSAAPHYFKRITIDNHTYYDGGIGYNDPTEQVYKDVLIHTGYGPSGDISGSLVLSLGTGMKPDLKQKAKGLLMKISPVKRLHENASIVLGTATNTIQVPENMRDHADVRNFEYFKWDGGGKVGALKLDECENETFQEMESGIETYMEEKSEELKRVAKLLVERRRARIKDNSRWQRFAYCMLFVCPRSKQCMAQFRTRRELRQHIQANHDDCSDPGSVAAREEPKMPDLRGPYGHWLR